MKFALKVQVAFGVLYVVSCFLLAEEGGSVLGITYFDLTAAYLLASAEIMAAGRLYSILRRVFR